MARLAPIALLLVALPTVALAIHEDQWLHVAIQDHEETVRINLPLTTVAAILPLIETEEFHRGRVRLDELDLELHRTDVVAILQEIRKAKDGEYITVEERDETVRVRKEGDYIRIHVEETHGGEEEHAERVEVRVPVKVLDALTSGEEGELDLLAAIEVLSEYEGQDLVTVTDHDESVRVWIDRKSSS